MNLTDLYGNFLYATMSSFIIYRTEIRIYLEFQQITPKMLELNAKHESLHCLT